MKLHFSLSRFELFSVSLRLTFRQQIIRIIYAVVLIGIIYQSWRATFSVPTLISKILMFVSFSIIPLLIMFLPVFLITLYSAYSSSNTILTKPVTISTIEDSIIIETEQSRTEAKLSALQKVERVGDYLFLRFSGYGGTPIPIRSFDSDEDLEGFIQFCEEQMQAA